MDSISPLEQAVLDAIELQVPEVADALADQREAIRVTARENTGAGFYGSLGRSKMALSSSPRAISTGRSISR
jgi:hypothetical protein